MGLFRAWILSDYDPDKKPSIIRKDATKPYDYHNLIIGTSKGNNALGSKVIGFYNGIETPYISAAEGARVYGLTRKGVLLACRSGKLYGGVRWRFG